MPHNRPSRKHWDTPTGKGQCVRSSLNRPPVQSRPLHKHPHNPPLLFATPLVEHTHLSTSTCCPLRTPYLGLQSALGTLWGIVVCDSFQDQAVRVLTLCSCVLTSLFDLPWTFFASGLLACRLVPLPCRLASTCTELWPWICLLPAPFCLSNKMCALSLYHLLSLHRVFVTQCTMICKVWQIHWTGE